jgi:hypothetical protein
MTAIPSKSDASTLWIILLTAASAVTTFAFSCATPFAALAALAAVHMKRQDGITLMLLSWAVSQGVGFVLLDYPHDAKTFAWGAGLATAAVGAVAVAYMPLPRFRQASAIARLILAYVAAFVAFKFVILLWALVLGGVDTTLDPLIVSRQFFQNAVILAGLFILYRALVALGVPPARNEVAPA